MKLSISSYSFAALIARGETDQKGCVKRAKELGFDAIEFTDLTPPHSVSEIDFALELRAEAEKNGIEISCYSVFADLLNRDFNEETDRLCKKVDVASALGAGIMRHDVSWGFDGKFAKSGYTGAIEKLSAGAKKITEYAKSKGIRTCTENHGRFSQDSIRVEALINAVNDDNFGALVDMGNFLCVDEDPVTAVGRLAPYAFNAHVKDFIVKRDCALNPGDGFFRSRGGAYLLGTVPGHGDVPLASCVDALKLAGYDGFYTLEFEGKEEINYALAAGADYLKRLIANR